MTQPGRGFRSIATRAAAELAVIILGVTIALSADSWVARKNDRAVEKARLQALSENIGQTLGALRSEMVNSDSAVAALRELATTAPRDWTSTAVERALMRGFFYVTVFRAELNVYDDLKNSGELSLLRDAELRRTLSALDSQLERLRLAQADMTAVQQLNLDSYLIRRIDLFPILGEYLDLDPGRDGGIKDLGFLGEAEFRNLVLFKLDLVVQLSGDMRRSEQALLAVDRSIASLIDPSR